MCGIAGIFAYGSDAPPVSLEELLKIRDQMRRRGPDGEGLWVSEGRRVGLAHRRLAILDLTDRGAQPMASADGQLVVTFNGEVYNYRELRRSLEARGCVFRSDSDTEVLLHLYAERGTDMLSELRGMYAFGIWDARKRGCFLARDSYGIKPLYYADDGKSLRFASQVKALLAGGAIDTRPEPAGHAGFFLWGSVPEPWTLYKGIRCLPAGHSLWIDDRGVGRPTPHLTIERVFEHADQNPAKGSRAEALDVVSMAIRDSIAAHQLSDVPVGVFLSAGMDSAMVASVTARRDAPTVTLTLCFEQYLGTPVDEGPLAQALAEALKTRHSMEFVRRDDFEEERESLLEAMDQPSFDGVNTWLVSRMAASLGLKVALSGLGGDELLASYPSFTDLPRIMRTVRPWSKVPGLGTSLRRVLSPVCRGPRQAKYASLVEYGGSLERAYLLRRGFYMPWQLSKVVDPEIAREGWKELAAIWQKPAVKSANASRLRISELESVHYMRNQLLRDADWAGMAHSVEIRVPFVDTRLLETTAPWLAAYPDLTKAEVAQAVAPDLPSDVLNRRKTGFSVPVREWMANPNAVVQEKDSGLRNWTKVVYRRNGGQPWLRATILVGDAYGGHGGIAYYNRCLSRALGAMPEVREVTLLPRLQRFSYDGLPPKVRQLDWGLGGKLRYLKAVARLLRDPADLVICGHVNMLALATLYARFKRAALVLQVHGIEVWPLHTGTVTERRRQARSFARNAKLLKRANAVWSVSKVTRDCMNSWAKLPLSKYQIMPNMVDLESFGQRAKRADLTDRWGLNDATVIMTLARLASSEKYKGIDEIIEVMPALLKSIPNLQYLVVGDGDDAPRLKEKVRRAELSDRVKFTGMISDAEKADYLRLADAFVMPGRGEGFGVVYLEAMACGVPVLGSVLDGSREALGDGAFGVVVDPSDAQSLRDGVIKSLKQPRGVPRGLEYYARDAFDWRVAQGTLELARRIA